ncbi:MAG TPA: class I SAM-dependent methyltransferase [Nitrospira sp.]|nr:class I SAM-dependent methyltransferase [Nitrospira sp.]
MTPPRQRTAEKTETESQQRRAGNAGDLGDHARVRVGCVLCGSRSSRLVCSPHDIADQRSCLERFYRRRWREHNAAAVTDRLKFTQNYSTGIAACTECGLLYRCPRPPADAVAKAYASERYDGAYLWDEFEAQRAWAHAKIPLLEKHLSNTSAGRKPRVLEIGSFVGGFLAEGTAQGWEMVGIDPGRDVTAFCRGQQLPVFQGTIEEAPLSPARFDAIVIWNTFDQLPDPHALLKRSMVVLRDGGLLVIRVPNGACFDWAMSLRATVPVRLRRLLDSALAWNNLLTFPYLYGYSADLLSRLCEPYGFRLLDCLADELEPVPAGHLKWWAAMEERATKWLCRLGAVAWRSGRRFRTAPWLELYFERACVDAEESSAKVRLGIIPVYAPLTFEDTGSDCRMMMQWDREGGLR